jgi:hypothetical protein
LDGLNQGSPCPARKLINSEHSKVSTPKTATLTSLIGKTDLCSRRLASGGELEQIQFLLGHVSIQTTERYLGSKQRIRSAVNDRIGIEPSPWVAAAYGRLADNSNRIQIAFTLAAQ